MGLFGAPKITMTLEKYNFNPGDIAKGTITINLKKSTYARKLEIQLLGVRRVRSGNSTQWQTVYRFEMPISGEKDYMADTVPFELQIPPDILQSRTSQQAIQESMEGKLGGAGKLLSAVTVGAGVTNWKIRAQLDIPKKLDVKYTQDVQIYAAQNTQQNGTI